jgi:Predicted ATPase
MVNNTDILLFQSVFKVGTVASVDGREVRVKVDKLKNSSHLIFKGELIKNVSVGSYVKIIKGFVPIIGKVESEFIEAKKDIVNSNYTSENEKIERLLKIKLLGFLENDKYCRGIKELPLIDSECFLLTTDEFNQIHHFVDGQNDIPLKIGTLASDLFVPISLGTKALFSSHIGIFGNTGSGKSYTLSKLYRQLFEKYKNSNHFKANAKFLFFDFNGEYAGENVIIAEKKVYNLSTRTKQDTIPLTNEDLLNLDLLCIFANATEKTQRPFIKRCIKLIEDIGDDVDKFKNFLKKQIIEILCMSDKVKADLLLDYVEQILPPKIDSITGREESLRKDFSFNSTQKNFYLGNFNDYRVFADTSKSDNQNYEYAKSIQIYIHVDSFQFSQNVIDKFIKVMYMRLIYDVLGNRAVNEHIAPAINKLKSVEADIGKIFHFSGQANDFWKESNIVVVNLNNVNLDSKKMLPMLLAHKLYTEHKAKRENELSYLNVIVDEAHNILSHQSDRESETWKDYRLETFEEIIKEGRKFGIFMTIASQRPSDISSTIISQLHNYFIHRLVNEEDIKMVNRTISYLDKVSVESLPILSTGVCVIAGQLAEMPIVVQIDKIEDENKPLNETIDVIPKWTDNENVGNTEEDIAETIKDDDFLF